MKPSHFITVEPDAPSRHEACNRCAASRQGACHIVRDRRQKHTQTTAERVVIPRESPSFERERGRALQQRWSDV